MAYLDNTVITVDAVLTKKGRERLGQGRDAFNITKFAVSDDEIDYTLYNTAHPLGSNYYSNIIESMPVLEAIPDESQTMRYKLASMQQGLKRAPVIGGVGLDFSVAAPKTLTVGDHTWEFTPKTIVYKTDSQEETTRTFDQEQGFTVILYDEEAATLMASSKLTGAANYTSASMLGSSPANFSSTVVESGHSFRIRAKTLRSGSPRTTKVTIFSNETGVTKTITLIVEAP